MNDPASRFHVRVGDAEPELDQRLSDELDAWNAEATRGVPPQRELTVQILDDAGELAAGMSGWTWGLAAGIGLPTAETADVHFRMDL